MILTLTRPVTDLFSFNCIHVNYMQPSCICVGFYMYHNSKMLTSSVPHGLFMCPLITTPIFHSDPCLTPEFEPPGNN